MTPGFLRSIPARGRPAAGLAAGLAGTLVIIGVLFPFCPPVFNAVVATRTACLEARREFPRALDMLEKWKGGMPVRRWRNDLMRSAAMGALFNGQFREACEYFTPIADIRDPVTGQSRPDYFMRIYRGISFEKRGMVNEARDDWEAAIAVIPRRHDAWLARGHSRLLDGDLLGAQADYMRALELSGRLGIVHVDIGDAWRYIGRNEIARETYRRGMAVDPGDVFCRLRLAEMALIMENDPEKAVRMSHEIQRMMPDLVVVEQVLEAARQWGPGSTLNHVPAARFEPGASRL